MVKRSFEEARKSPYYKAQTKTLIFISQIEDLMRNRKISKKELAERMGVSAAYISKIFNCSVNISMITMEKLANALKMEMSQPQLYDISILCSEAQNIKTENNEIKFTYDNNNDNIDLSLFEKAENKLFQQIKIS
jgi:transcriptional regulator with XRE-family HTH domain